MAYVEIEYFDSSFKRQRLELKEYVWSGDSAVWENPGLGFAFEFKKERCPGGDKFSVAAGSIREYGVNKLASFVFRTTFMSGQEGDDAEFILPCDIGVSCRMRDKDEGEYMLPGFTEPEWPPYVMNMLMAGEITSTGSRLMIIDDCRHDSGFRLRTNYGKDHQYQLDPVFILRRDPADPLPEDSPAVLCCEVNGGLVQMAVAYRAYIMKKLNISPLKAKFASSEALRQSAESLMIRLRMATKPVPAPVDNQTTENQPEVRKLMDFDDAVRLAEECARQGIENIDFTFVGWNYGGHDGAFPQIFPVEEKLGGQAAMERAIKRIKELGYKVGIHDNFIDSYTLADNLDCSDWAVDSRGEVLKGEIWGGGRAHLLCPKQSLDRYLPEHFTGLETFGFNGAYYVDVLSLLCLYPCASPKHPVSHKEAMRYWKKILLKQREFSGVAMSEGIREWALPELDRAYAASNRPDPHVELPFADKTVPLVPIIFHGLVIYNSCRMTINAMPGDKLYLENIAFGGLPLLYFYQRFQGNSSIINRGCEDLKITTNEKLREDVSRIKRISEDLKQLASLQTEFITNYERSKEGLSCISYGNGKKLYVNHTEIKLAADDGTIIPDRNFIIKQEKRDETKVTAEKISKYIIAKAINQENKKGENP